MSSLFFAHSFSSPPLFLLLFLFFFFFHFPSAVDKLDKLPWAEVRKEMVEVKKLDGEVADKLSKYILKKNDPMALYEELSSDEELMKNELLKKALEEMKVLFGYLECYKCLKYLSFDMSLGNFFFQSFDFIFCKRNSFIPLNCTKTKKTFLHHHH